MDSEFLIPRGYILLTEKELLELQGKVKRLEIVKRILIEAESDDPYVGEAITLQKIANVLGIKKQFLYEGGEE